MVLYQGAVLPRWASDDSVADIVEPTGGKKDLGWVGGATPDRPPAQFMNWLRRRNYDAHAQWRESLWYAAADAWTVHDSQLHLASGTLINNSGAMILRKDLGVALAAMGGSGRTYVATTTDGETWTLRDSVVAANSDPGGVATDGNLILVTGGTTDAAKFIRSSTDSTTWASQTANFTPTCNGLETVLFDPIGNRWIVFEKSGDDVFSAIDPTTAAAWTKRADLASNNARAAVNPFTGKIIASATDGTLSVSTNGGANWAVLTHGFEATFTTVIGAIEYARQDGLDVWVLSGRTTSPRESAWLYSTDDGVTWSRASFADGYPSYSINDPVGPTLADAHTAFYSPVLKHWLFCERNSTLSFRVYAGQPGIPSSWSLRTFASPTGFISAVDVGKWVDLDPNRTNQFWLLIANANRSESAVKSRNPFF